MMHHPLSKLLFGLLFLLPALTWALPSDREKPINIEADHAQLDDELGITQYKGRAILTQGTLRIEGDIITFYYDADKQLKKAVAQGKPATYKQIQKQGEEPVRARGLQMEYHAQIQKIYLLGDGHVWQKGDEFSGNRIEYDITKNVVNANSQPVKIDNQTKKGSGRIHIIINPNANKPAKVKKPAAKPKPQTAVTEPVAAPEIADTQPEPAAETIEQAPEQINEPAAVEAAVEPEFEEENGYPIGYTVTRLNVRTGPGTQYDKVETFPQGSELVILTEQNEWLQVRGEVGDDVIIGWVHKDYLTATSP